MIQPTPVAMFTLPLVLTGIITDKEAVQIRNGLMGQRADVSHLDLELSIEKILGRNLRVSSDA